MRASQVTGVRIRAVAELVDVGRVAGRGLVVGDGQGPVAEQDLGLGLGEVVDRAALPGGEARNTRVEGEERPHLGAGRPGQQRLAAQPPRGQRRWPVLGDADRAAHGVERRGRAARAGHLLGQLPVGRQELAGRDGSQRRPQLSTRVGAAARPRISSKRRVSPAASAGSCGGSPQGPLWLMTWLMWVP